MQSSAIHRTIWLSSLLKHPCASASITDDNTALIPPAFLASVAPLATTLLRGYANTLDIKLQRGVGWDIRGSSFSTVPAFDIYDTKTQTQLNYMITNVQIH